MKITRIAFWHKTLPLAHPYWLSGGRLKFETLDSTTVRIDTEDGLTGWGEGCPWGHTYLPAFGGGLRTPGARTSPRRQWPISPQPRRPAI